MKKIGVVFTLVVIMFMVGCATHSHVVGNGAQGMEQTQQRQWYVLFGLVPINNVETEIMAAGATDYTIKTQQSALDVIINIFTGGVSVYSRTVTVSQ